MIMIDPILSSICLAVLAQTQLAKKYLISAFAVVPLLIVYAPSPIELALTILTEAPIVYALGKRFELDAVKCLVICCFVNALTQPLLYFTLEHVITASAPQWWGTFAVSELAVLGVEALLYLACLKELRLSRASVRRAMVVSFSANATSAGLGLLIPY